MTIDSPDYKSSIERFNEIFKQIIEKYNIKDWEELLKNELSKEDMKNLISEYNITWEDKYELMDSFHEMNEERLKKNALVWAKAAIIMRNLSHNIWKTFLFPRKDPEFDKFADFCDVDVKEIKWVNKFQEIFLKDSEKLKDHPLNKRYQELREQLLSPYEAITFLPWSDEALSWWDYETPLAKSNKEVMEGSKMWSTKYCTWRVNTILWIVALNEWIDYVNKHFKYAEFLKDWLCDIMAEVPWFYKDEAYLNEYLNYEDPHQMLIFIDDDWSEYEIDPNQIAVNQANKENQLSYSNITFDNVTRKFDWNVWEVAYEMYFLNYINEELRKDENNPNRASIIRRLESYNQFVWWSEIIIKWLIAHAINTRDTKLEKKYIKKLKELWEKYPCIKDKFSYHVAMDDEKALEKFVHDKYWEQFSPDDAFAQFK